MTDNRLCPLCAEYGVFTVEARPETVLIKGKSVEFTASFTRCPACGGEFETPEQVDANLGAVRDEYSARYEAPTPDEIRSLRDYFGASQKAFGLVLGLGELTINSYERGEVPNGPNRTLLRLAADPVVFCRLYTMNKWKIGGVQRRRIEESPGFTAGAAWVGLESIKQELAEPDSSCLEAVAAESGRSLGSWCAETVMPPARRSLLAPLQSTAPSVKDWVEVTPFQQEQDAVGRHLEKVGA